MLLKKKIFKNFENLISHQNYQQSANAPKEKIFKTFQTFSFQNLMSHRALSCMDIDDFKISFSKIIKCHIEN